MPQDYAKAKKWYNLSAAQGHAAAQNNLGGMYEKGEGVPKNDVKAYAWYSVAAVSGDDDYRKNRDRIKDRLTPSQLEKGQVLATEYHERIERNKKRKAEKAE